jgi:hypothetical protein
MVINNSTVVMYYNYGELIRRTNKDHILERESKHHRNFPR